MTTLVLVLQVVQLEKEYRQLAKAVEKVADEAHTANHKIATVRQTPIQASSYIPSAYLGRVNTPAVMQ